MEPVPLVRAGLALPVIAFLEKRGARIGETLATAGLPPWIFRDPEALVPTTSIVRFLDGAARAHAVADLGLRAGLDAPLESLGVLGRLVANAPTLREALHAEIGNHRTFSSTGSVWLEVDGPDVRICHAFQTGFDDGWRQTDHYVLALVVALLHRAGGRSWRPARVELQTGECGFVREHPALAGAAIAFDRAATTVAFPATLLDAALARSAESGPPRPIGIDAWRASAPADGFERAMAQIVATLSRGGGPAVGLTARVLGTSVRTLQRQLAAAGLTHEALVGRVRFDTAAVLLRETDAKIVDIALDLGYSDHAHFTRAFRRWAGCPPQDYRRRSRAVAAPEDPHAPGTPGPGSSGASAHPSSGSYGT